MANLKDVAEKAGVSDKTAWKVLGGQTKWVSKNTQAKVRKAAEELGYSLGQRTRRKKSLIGVCIPDPEAAHYAELTNSIIYFARARGFVVIPQHTNDNQVDEQLAVNMLKRLGVEAVVLTSSRIGKKTVCDLEDDGILVVAIVSIQPDLKRPLPYFTTALRLDHYQGTFEATKYLTSLGHKHIAYLSGPRNSSSNIAKLAGYKAALHEPGLAEENSHVIVLDRPKFDYQAGYDGCLELMYLPEKERPTSIVCYNDELALGALISLIEHNIRVPEQVSVIGNDDIKHTRFCNPPLTTIRVPRLLLAQTAVERIDAYLGGAGWQEPELVVPELVIRKSTAPPPET